MAPVGSWDEGSKNRGNAAPKTAQGVLQNYLSQLRGVVGPEVLTHTVSGYVLAIEPERVDSERFVALAAQAHQADRRGDAAATVELSTAARALWRGPSLIEVADAEFAQPIIAKLTHCAPPSTSCTCTRRSRPDPSRMPSPSYRNVLSMTRPALFDNLVATLVPPNVAIIV